MKNPRSSRHPRSAADTCRDVLSGRREVTVDEALDLLHQVNPTGLDLPETERQRRYEEKSALQGLLLCRFGAEIEATPEPHRPGVVRLTHRPTGRSACHTMLESLDPEARALLRRRLDEDQAPPPTPASSRDRRRDRDRDRDRSVDPTDAESLLRAGHRAQSAYDYDLARTHFAAALDLDPGPAAALPLLTLLVDHLAADEDALALRARLSPAAASHPAARALLALAAARLDRGDEARALVRDLHTPAAAASLLVLAEAALSAPSPDLAAADELLREARARDPAHSQVASLGERLAALRGAERAPLEAELAARLAAQDDAGAEALARQVLSRWPESEPARRALHALGVRRRSEEAAALHRHAEAAAAEGRLDAALAHLEAALSLPLVSPELRAALSTRQAELAATARDLAARARTEEALRLLQHDLPAGLRRYLDLPPSLQREVAATLTLPHLTWLADIERGLRGASADEAVAAVLALAEAQALLPEDPAAALRCLSGHERLLDHVPAYRRLCAEARRREDEARRSRAQQMLLAAQREYGNDPAVLLSLLDRAELHLLSAAEQAEAARLRRDAIQAARRTRLGERIHEDMRNFDVGRVLEVLRRFDEYLAGYEDHPSLAGWRERRDQLRHLARELHRPLYHEGEGPADELRDLDLTELYFGGPHDLVLPGGREAIFVTALGMMVFLRVLDLERGRVTRRCVVRAPGRIGPALSCVRGESVWVLGVSGAVLQLSLPEFDIVRWHTREEVAGDRPLNNIPLPTPDGRYLWMVRRDETRPSIDVLDLERMTRRTLALRSDPEVVRGEEGLVVAVRRRRGALELHAPAGPLLRELPVEPWCRLRTIAALPDASGIVAVTGFDYGVATDEEKQRLRPQGLDEGWRVLGPGGPGPEHHLPQCSMAMICRLGSTSSLGVLRHVTGSGMDLDGHRLMALAPDAAEGLRPIYDALVPRSTVLLRDPGHERLWAVCNSQEGVAVAEVGTTPPLLPDDRLPWALDVLSPWQVRCNWNFRLCWGEGEPAATCHQVRAASAAERARLRERGDPLVREALMLTADEPEEALAEARALRAAYPERVLPRLVLAHHAAEAAEWGEGADLLDGLSVTGLPVEAAMHLHHLRVLFWLWQGNGAAALYDIECAAALSHRNGKTERCGDLGVLRGLCRPPDPARPEEWGPGKPIAQQLYGAVVAADRCLAHGDPAGALREVDRMPFFLIEEVQVLARLARAHLRLAPEGGVACFRWANALARFIQAYNNPGMRRELPYPGHTLGTDELERLAKEAHDALIEFCRHAAGLPSHGTSAAQAAPAAPA